MYSPVKLGTGILSLALSEYSGKTGGKWKHTPFSFIRHSTYYLFYFSSLPSRHAFANKNQTLIPLHRYPRASKTLHWNWKANDNESGSKSSNLCLKSQWTIQESDNQEVWYEKSEYTTKAGEQSVDLTRAPGGMAQTSWSEREWWCRRSMILGN